MLRTQRPGGRIDLPTCNPDSGPDTAFVVQLLCAVLELIRIEPRRAARLPAVVVRGMERFVARAAGALGEFHTPNHRWVVASALAQTGALFPKLRHEKMLRALLAEGFDLDADGFYLERSPAIYDAVSNRSLLLLHEFADAPDALSAVERSLLTDLSPAS